uniref:Copine-8 n=1 Tax=Bursaphelenchus xylophilus TaxID=6326 RepID=A0A1I7S2X2_BURXY
MKTYNEPKSKVELVLAARNLADRDVLSKSDPMCVVYRVDNNVAREVARTEIIWDNLSPNWATKIKLDYFFERRQTLLFKIYDIDSPNATLSEHDFLGSCSTDLADILAAPNGYLTLSLGGWNRAKGHLIVFAEEVTQVQNDIFLFKIQGIDLHKKFHFIKPDTYLEFYRHLPDGSRQLVVRTGDVKMSCFPNYPKVELKIRQLCGNEPTNEFTVQCHRVEKHGNVLIGEVTTTFDKIKAAGSSPFPIINPRKVRHPNYKDSGALRFLESVHERSHSFLEYIKGGLQLEFAVCIDFTASNGPVHSQTSLHYIDPNNQNQYEMAIAAVLEICQHYNHSKQFEVMGFGAKIPPGNQVSHLFPLDVESRQRVIDGVDSVLGLYRKTLLYIQFYGPTNFSPSIQEFAYKASLLAKEKNRYQILLIITDGEITDMAKTINSIVDASDKPLSIIIVGVGGSSFDKMDDLDSDQALLTTANGKQALRDIVQFVPFRDFFPPSGMPRSVLEADQIKRRLAEAVLEEVPDQVTSYMRMMGISPGPPILQLPPGEDILSFIPPPDASFIQPPTNPSYGFQPQLVSH